MLHWGANCEEVHKPLPGDETVPGPAVQSTRAVTIDAPVDAVWPWLAQLGQDRGRLLQLRGPREPRRLPHAQRRRDPPGVAGAHGPARPSTCTPAAGLRVTRFEPGRVLALENWGAFVLEPRGSDRTRLIARGRTPRGPASIVNALLMEIPHFVMERKMLLGIKRRAEQSHTATVRRAAQAEPAQTVVHA